MEVTKEMKFGTKVA